jgi:hypothetical protein
MHTTLMGVPALSTDDNIKTISVDVELLAAPVVRSASCAA